jgi:F0F1-type ATP synthase assembly protein I
MKRWEAAFRLLGLGWYIGVCILLGVIGGLWLDNKFHSTPVFIIIGLLLGIVIAFYGVYRMVLPNFFFNNKKINSKDDKNDEGKS